MSDRASGTLARLAWDALRAAESSRLGDVRSVAEFLYQFNSIPPTDRWQRTYPDRESTVQALGAGRGTESRSLLHGSWLEIPASTTPGWWTWTARHQGDEVGASGPELKLYISPTMEDLRPAFESLVEVLHFSRALSFKVGADAAGLLRPDKIVVYFSDLEDLTATAHRCAARLRGIAAQGVPFTSEIGCGGLLSWSVDPPPSAHRASTPPPTWRIWITHRAALALVAAQRRVDGEQAPWRCALDQLSREGVDVDRWRPRASQWISRSAWL